MKEVKINSNFGQDIKRAKRFEKQITKILEPLKKAGIIDFKAVTKRICDFCNKTLNEGDKYEIIGDLDKCENCSGVR